MSKVKSHVVSDVVEVESQDSEASAKKLAATTTKGRDLTALIDGGEADFDKLEGNQLSVEIRKPNKEWHVRTHPDTAQFWRIVRLIEMKEEPWRGFWLPDRNLHGLLELETCSRRHLLVLSVNSEGTYFLWPIPASDGDFMRKLSLAQRTAAELAKDNWIRVTWNGNQHVGKVIEANEKEPKWPEEDFVTLLAKATDGRFIDSVSHELIRHLGLGR